MNKSTLLKAGLTIGFFLVLFTRISPSDLLAAFESLNVLWFLAALLVMPLLYIVKTLRWEFLLRSSGITNRFAYLFRVVLIGTFLGLITPGKIGELGRAYYLGEKKSVVLATVTFEKILDIVVLLFLSIVTVMVYFMNYAALWYGIILLCIITGVLVVLIMHRKYIILMAGFFRVPPDRVEMFADAFFRLFRNPRTVAISASVTFLYYFLAYILGLFLIFSLGAEVIALFTLPLIVLMGNLPITISGLGLRESVAAILFALLGESGSTGLVFSLMLFTSMTLVPGIFGYVLSLTTPVPSSGTRGPSRNEKGQITGLFSPWLEEWRMKKVIHYIAGQRVLDYGCGYGTLASRVGSREYVGVDRNEDVLAAARTRYRDSPNVSFSSPDEFFASDKGLFDTIVLAAVLEHLEDPEAELVALKQRLAEHGKIVITTPSRGADRLLGFGSRFHLFSAEAHEEHVHFFDKSAFYRTGVKIGLKMEVFRTFQCGLNQLVVYTNA